MSSSEQGAPRDQDALAVRAAYDDVAADYATYLPDTRAEAPADLAMVDDFVAAVRSFAAPEQATVLDAGCGTGRMSRYLADRGVQVRGVDLSPGMIEQAARHHADIPFDVGSIAALPCAAATFDGVLLWYSFIHTPASEQPGIFSEARRVVRDGGFVLAGFQVGKGVQDVSDAYRPLGHDIALVRYPFTPDQVAGWLADAGFTEVQRLVRPAAGREREDQGFLLARA